MERDDSIASSMYISAEQLRVGLYVFIDLQWFQHPFMLNEFRIRSEEQIRALKGLGQSRFRYDPARSDELPDGATAASPESEPMPDASIEVPPDAACAAMEHPTRPVVLAEHRKRIAQVERSFLKSAALLRHLHRNLVSRPAETLEDIEGLVEQMLRSFLEHPEVTLHAITDKCAGDEFHSHVLNVSVLSMMLTKGLDFDTAQARSLGLGALVHDIGLMDIPDRVLNKSPDDYSRPEQELRAMHCEFGLRIGTQIGLPPDVLAIIHQHHEMVDGTGYPLGLTLDEMTMPARVVALVNYYDNLCNPLDLSHAMTPHEALAFMFARRRNKFDARILQQLIRCLGVYPPGSIVMLSNDAFALVMSVNPAKPLRPWIMLYDPEVPKEHATLLNLEEDATVNISKAVRPAMLPPRVRDYLSPRRRVAYFFDSNAQMAGVENT